MLLALLIWLVIGTGAGFIAMFYGPGAVTMIAGFWLGFCGSIVHLLTTALGRELHWSYAGLVIGAFTLLAGIVVVGGVGNEPAVPFFLFVVFSATSYIIFPMANYALKRSIGRNVDRTSIDS